VDVKVRSDGSQPELLLGGFPGLAVKLGLEGIHSVVHSKGISAVLMRE
jgi:hypothetical protein